MIYKKFDSYVVFALGSKNDCLIKMKIILNAKSSKVIYVYYYNIMYFNYIFFILVSFIHAIYAFFGN